MNIADYPPTIEAINEWLLYPYHFQEFSVSFTGDNGEMITMDGELDLVFSRLELSWMTDGKICKTVLDMSAIFDKDSIESKSLIVHDTNGGAFLLILK